jgi:hypothetical protein
MRQSTLPPFRSGNLASCLPLRDLSHTDLEVLCFVPRLVGYHVRSLHRQPALCNQRRAAEMHRRYPSVPVYVYGPSPACVRSFGPSKPYSLQAAFRLRFRSTHRPNLMALSDTQVQ